MVGEAAGRDLYASLIGLAASGAVLLGSHFQTTDHNALAKVSAATAREAEVLMKTR